MKLPIKQVAVVQQKPRVFDAYDSFGGAILDGVSYVKECRAGEIVEKSKTFPYRRGVVKNKVVYYYLKIGDTPPIDENLIASTWEAV